MSGIGRRHRVSGFALWVLVVVVSVLVGYGDASEGGLFWLNF